MKLIKYIFLALCSVLLLSACSDDQVSTLKLDGVCDVETFVLNETYKAEIDVLSKTITVRVPEGSDLSRMTITGLSLSQGAKSNIAVGSVLDFTSMHTLHVVNGDVFMDWNIRVRQDEAKIYTFRVNGTYLGIIDETAKTIQVSIPDKENIKSLNPTFTCSEGADVSPASGVAVDFTNPVVFTVKNNTATSAYTVTVKKISKPNAVYLGLAGTMDQLNAEELTACKWMLANVPNSMYVSFDDIKYSNVDLSACKVIWWHYHKDGGVDGKEAFEKSAPIAVDVALKLRDYYIGGGSFLLTRYATNLPAYIGAVANQGVPNNCWGQFEDNAELTSAPWSFSMAGHQSHPLFHGLVIDPSVNDQVFTTDAGYRITNSTAQWHIGSDWGGYSDLSAWRLKTGGVDLAYGGDGAVVAWEFPRTANHGAILCIGSGCYDWYSTASVTEYYHKNVSIMTKNAFTYLTQN